MRFKDVMLTAPRPLNPVDRAIEDVSRVVCSLLILGLKRKLKFDRFWRISIRINHPDDPKSGSVALGILVVNRPFPSDEFVGWNLSRRQNYMLDFVSGILKEVCVVNDQDVAVVEESCSFVLEHKFLRTIVGKSSFPGPDQESSAHIECDQEMDQARIYIVATFPNEKIRRLEVATSRPDEFIIQGYFGKLDWKGPRTIILRTRGGIELPANF
jgi:hypothetical protein